MRNVTLAPPIIIRPSDASDALELWRLSQLDSAEPLEGPALVAEYGGQIVAAVTLDGTRAIADPFEPTLGIVNLIRTWVGEVG